MRGEVANNIERVCRRGIKKTKWGGGGCCEKNVWGGSMLKRGKEDKMQEAGVAKKLRGGVCRRGVEKTKCEGGGLMQKKKLGDMPERGKRQYRGWGGGGGRPGLKARGGRSLKNLGGGQWKIMSSLGGSIIKWNSPVSCPAPPPPKPSLSPAPAPPSFQKFVAVENKYFVLGIHGKKFSGRAGGENK